MFEQYLRIKEGYPDALLFYRMGDFYELFFEDAEVASRELQIALTSRNPNAEAPIPMCGVPWHAAEGYVSQLLNKGYKLSLIHICSFSFLVSSPLFLRSFMNMRYRA